MITGVAPRYQAHRNFSGAPLCRSAAWRASQTAHRRALEEFRCRNLCPKATSGLVGAGRTGRRVWAGQHACGACAMARPLPHVTRRYGRVPSKVKLWITTSVTRQIPAAGPRATAPGTVTWTYASRPSPGTSRAAEPELEAGVLENTEQLDALGEAVDRRFRTIGRPVGRRPRAAGRALAGSRRCTTRALG